MNFQSITRKPMENNLSLGVAIITHRAKHHLPKCLPPLLKSPLQPRILVVNSSSQDGTAELAQEMGAEVLLIPRNEFNHGTTRERARKHLGTKIVAMMTPDAYPLNEELLSHLVKPLVEGSASVAYARQIPHDGADFFESFPREFNYPAQSEVRSFADVKRLGIYTYFCSDTCAAYLNEALDDIGGFEQALFGEDTVAVAKLLKKGHHLAYVAEAIVKHSHRYTLLQEFRRHFDIGLARKGYADLIADGGSDSKRGASFVKQLFKKVAREKPYLLPYAFVQTAVKFCGYKIGQSSTRAPHWFKKTFSSQDFYWQTK